jgi:hypothetical protein
MVVETLQNKRHNSKNHKENPVMNQVVVVYFMNTKARNIILQIIADLEYLSVLKI